MPQIIVPKASVWKEFDLNTDRLVDSTKIKLHLKILKKKDSLSFGVLLAKLFPEKAEESSKEKSSKEERKSIPVEEVVNLLQTNMDFILDFIIGWDLMIKDKLIPCTKENKIKYLDELLWEDVKQEKAGEEEKKDDDLFPLLGMEIVKFCSDTKNFIKN